MKMVSYFFPSLNHIHQNTVMRDEHIVSIQSCMQLLPTEGPVVVLQRLEEQFPEWSKIILCAEKRIVTSYAEDMYGRKYKMFSRNLVLHFIFCGLIF